MDARTAIETARAHFDGNLSELARQAGVERQTIQIARREGRISAELAMKLENATKGAVRAQDMRPDLPWPSGADNG